MGSIFCVTQLELSQEQAFIRLDMMTAAAIF